MNSLYYERKPQQNQFRLCCPILRSGIP
jgi:hypothetical protein